MELLIDTSVAYFLFSRDPFVREMIASKGIKLYSVPELFAELRKDSSKLCKITKRSPKEVEEMISLLESVIEVKEPSPESIEKAGSMISHRNDVPFLALALELDIPIWSNDRHFKDQAELPVYNMAELKKLPSSEPSGSG